MIDIDKYKTRFINEANLEVDSIFKQEKSKERDDALLLVTVLIVKVEKILRDIENEIKETKM